MARFQTRHRRLAPLVVCLIGHAAAACSVPTATVGSVSSRPPEVTSSHSPSTATKPNETGFPAPPPAVRATALRFTKALLEYDTRSEHRSDFLDRIRPLATKSVRDALSRSTRARLDWRIMRGRDERVALEVTGSSILDQEQGVLAVVVNGIATTTTEVAVLREPVVLRLLLVRTPHGWKVAGLPENSL